MFHQVLKPELEFGLRVKVRRLPEVVYLVIYISLLKFQSIKFLNGTA